MGLFQWLHLSDSGSHVSGGELASLSIWIFIHTSVFLVLEPLQATVTEEWTASHNSHRVSLVIFLSVCPWATLTPHTCPFLAAQLTSSLAVVCCESRRSD